ncbi:MAG: radical SAM protein [Candidatus Omnitrophota bacterium]|nr:radical SAM protein [Candidatus Omnitrophota bacterium]MBU1928342.1 radical SAM protein [Candidatus Omnitrophota bacterium]MBU2034322.1 radical SAM protein [Candidatus Omnitrophota bacterium]MBU2258168.1 radical SAM protein [Candidatus Omnitrophota bacterium]
MRIVLVNLPWYNLSGSGVRAGSRWPHLRARHEQGYLPYPFFLAYAAALLKKNDFEVILIDAIAGLLSYSGCINRLRSLKPDLCVFETSTVTLKHDVALIKKINKNIPVVLCGPDVNMQQPSFINKNPFITYIIFGEYEFTLLDLAQHIRDKRDASDVPGLIYRHYGKTIFNQARELTDLNKFPWPLREGLPMTNYNDAPGNMPLPSVQMVASRGCPYSCKFCLWPQVMYQGNNYRFRDVEDVIKEMKFLVNNMGFKSVYFDDDTFNCGKPRMLAFCDEIKKQNLADVPWAIMARPDLMDEEMLMRMKDSGLYAVKYGVESATQSLLDGISKSMDLRKTEKMIRFTEQLGIKTHLTFTFGLPGETRESIRRTIDFAINLNPNSVQFSIATPFPGTEFYREIEKSGRLLTKKWSEYDGNNKSVICSDNLSKKELEKSIRVAYKRWRSHYLNRRYLRGQRLNISLPGLILFSLERRGIFLTAVKLLSFVCRQAKASVLIRVNYLKERFKRRPERVNFIGAGRAAIFFDATGAHLFWDNIELTRQGGFTSCFNGAKESKKNKISTIVFSDFKKDTNYRISLKKKYGDSNIEEDWKFDILDEKQIDWSVRIHNGHVETQAGESRFGLILSDEYQKWVDSWGEGGFYPAFDNLEVELRNPKTKLVGVRGRKKFRRQIPTILLDATSNNSAAVCVRNSPVLGARILEVKQTGDVFSGRIKIVEENLKKRKR